MKSMKGMGQNWLEIVLHLDFGLFEENTSSSNSFMPYKPDIYNWPGIFLRLTFFF